MNNPYEVNPNQPQFPGQQPAQQMPLGPQSKPQVCVWYKVYCGCFLAVYILTAIAGILLLVFAEQIAASSPDPNNEIERISNIITGSMLIAISVLLCGLFGVGLSIPQKKWGWIYGFFPIAIGMTSPCCMPASIPLLIFWLKPETKRWFGV